MNWKGHLILGIVAMIISTIVIYVLSEIVDLFIWETTFVILGWIIGLYCSLLPDIDIKTSKVFNFTLMCCLLAIIWFVIGGFVIELIAVVIFLIIISLLSHRGIMHKWYMAIVISIIFTFVFMSIIVGIFAFMGYIFHAGIEKSH